MAKQTELKNLLQELEVATRKRERLLRMNFSTTPDENARAFHAADGAEKRVFSFFDKLSTELEDSARAYKSLQDQRNFVVNERDNLQSACDLARQDNVSLQQRLDAVQKVASKAQTDLQELAKQVMAMTPTDAPQMGEPFNSTRAAAGEAIEVLMAADMWIEKQFIGTFRDNHQLMVTYVHNGVPDWAPLQSVRMKAKPTQQLQMFANVYQASNGEVWGNLHATAEKAKSAVDRATIAAAVPVTITVAK